MALAYRIWAGLTVSAMFALTGLGCTTPKAVATNKTINCMVPTITPQPESKETQEKGGLQISIAPVSYGVRTEQDVTVTQVAPPPIVLTTRGGTTVWVDRKTTTSASVEPDRIKFLVKINNKMPRVFYGKGTVVQFNVGGRLQAVDQFGYSNFLGAIIPPRQELQLEIVGPTLASLGAHQGTIGVFLYDVVTDQDKAGTVTEKQNYEWYFDYRLQPRAVPVEERLEHQTEMSIHEYQEVMTKQQMQRGMRQQQQMMQQAQQMQQQPPPGYAAPPAGYAPSPANPAVRPAR
jgi:hypothetical protein